MESIKRSSRRWRLNYVISYIDPGKADAFRNFVLETMVNAARLRKIDYAIEQECGIYDGIRSELHTPFQDIVADMVYFRSSPASLSSVRDFRMLIDSLFHGYDILCGHPFGVHAQLLKHLNEFPFPEIFCRPLSYPRVEFHKGQKSSVCIPEAHLLSLLTVDSSPELN